MKKYSRAQDNPAIGAKIKEYRSGKRLISAVNIQIE
jgi:hypothetical protein